MNPMTAGMYPQGLPRALLLGAYREEPEPVLFKGGVMETFNELAETKISGDGKVTVKRHVTDEETLAEMEFAEACDKYVRAARKFEKLDRIAKAQKGIPDNLCEWFDALEEQYEADKRLWLLFVGKNRSERSNLMYVEYRRALLSGKSLRADG